MALVNHAKKEINAKIVYYGPAESGKNSALTYIYSRIKPSLRGEFKRVPAGSDNLQFFDFSPFETPLPNGYRFRLHVYTLTGKVTNPATWKMTLKGTDGILIFVTPKTDQMPETQESVAQLRNFLSAYGVGLHDTPAVLQLNSFPAGKRREEAAEIAAALDLSALTTCHANTSSGEGLLEALTILSRQVLDRVTITERHDGENDRSESFETTTPANRPVGTVTAGQDTLAGVEKVVPIPQAIAKPPVTLLSKDIILEGSNLRIPLEIDHGATKTRLVVSISITSE